ncbi:hypothetical protein [Ramlibacter sp.]|uniref:hypothetical protein n=1 Tax=Ramlibacter sp. TaxID=1917967 RepID=UPI003D1015EF
MATIEAMSKHQAERELAEALRVLTMLPYERSKWLEREHVQVVEYQGVAARTLGADSTNPSDKPSRNTVPPATVVAT